MITTTYVRCGSGGPGGAGFREKGPSAGPSSHTLAEGSGTPSAAKSEPSALRRGRARSHAAVEQAEGELDRASAPGLALRPVADKATSLDLVVTFRTAISSRGRKPN